ncbi:MAG: NUDIX domain-containing protein [Patescibacteria group bacterium]
MSQKLFLEISDSTLDPNYKMGDVEKFSIRRAARGILWKEDKIALLHVTRLNYHKLPGGGVEGDEQIEDAYKREILEEVGCKTNDIKGHGLILEWRDKFKLQQLSYIFESQIDGEVGARNMTQEEIDEGFELLWLTPTQALKILEEDNPTDYEAKFIQKRDVFIVKSICGL